MTISIAILAGGHSRRMGQDKAQLRVDGETFLERTFRVASATGNNTIIVGRSRPDNWLHDNAMFIGDDIPELGPLGGLASALRYSGTAILLLACDMPQLTTDALSWLLTISSTIPNRHGLIVSNGRQIEPLFSLYFPPSLSLVEEQIARNVLAMRHFIAAGDFGYAEVPAEHVPTLYNVNRPEEYKAEG